MEQLSSKQEQPSLSAKEREQRVQFLSERVLRWMDNADYVEPRGTYAGDWSLDGLRRLRSLEDESLEIRKAVYEHVAGARVSVHLAPAIRTAEKILVKGEDVSMMRLDRMHQEWRKHQGLPTEQEEADVATERPTPIQTTEAEVAGIYKEMKKKGGIKPLRKPRIPDLSVSE